MNTRGPDEGPRDPCRIGSPRTYVTRMHCLSCWSGRGRGKHPASDQFLQHRAGCEVKGRALYRNGENYHFQTLIHPKPRSRQRFGNLARRGTPTEIGTAPTWSVAVSARRESSKWGFRFFPSRSITVEKLGSSVLDPNSSDDGKLPRSGFAPLGTAR